MHMTLRFTATLPLAVGITALIATISVRADWLQPAAGTYEYNDTANWAGGTIDDLFPPTLSVAGDQTILFSADRTLPAAWNLLHAGPGNLTLAGFAANRTATLGGDFTVDSVSNARSVMIGSVNADENLSVALVRCSGISRSRPGTPLKRRRESTSARSTNSPARVRC